MAVNDARASSRLDLRAAVEGALLTLAIAVPPLWIVLILKSGDAPGEESNLWLLAPVALLGGFAVGGFRTAARRRETPLMHAAAAGAMAFAVLLVVSLVRRAVGDEEVSVVHLVRLLLLAQICISAALLGGYVGMRRAARRATR
ncbi:MAG: hypothetical protein KY443_03570 [Actinobacteria bacterium]|nr:hypothetical protein [Actinomycetota bacterium]